jgi:hypothetical protein
MTSLFGHDAANSVPGGQLTGTLVTTRTSTRGCLQFDGQVVRHPVQSVALMTRWLALAGGVLLLAGLRCSLGSILYQVNYQVNPVGDASASPYVPRRRK